MTSIKECVMSKLDSFFEKRKETFRHPLLTYLDGAHPDSASIEVMRRGDVLGFKASKIYLNLVVGGKPLPPAEYGWDDELNEALVMRGIRAVSVDNEKIRFGLGLRSSFKRPETRFGDGFFNSVLVIVIKEFGFADYPEVADVLSDVHTNQPHMGGNGYTDCHAMVTNAISDQATQLVDWLKYNKDEAREILSGAMARYLDERFTVSSRRRLGWT
jgi:hypothetical protein